MKRNNPGPYTKYEESLLKRYYTELPMEELQKMFPQRTAHSIVQKAGKMGLSKYHDPWTKDDIDLLIKMVKEDKTQREVIEVLGKRKTKASIRK